MDNKKLEDGLIIKLTGGNYYVIVKDNIYKCKARGLFRHQNIKPVVGDYVKIEITDEKEGYIYEVKERKSLLERPAIANLSQAFIIISYMEPKYSYNLLNKFLAIVEHYQIKPVIVVTKIDLANNIDEVKEAFKIYEDCQYEVVYTSMFSQENVEYLIDKIDNEISVLVGQSGSGKSSLLNLFNVDLNLKTNAISKALNRGKHTTRHVELFTFKNGMIADSPGFSSLTLDMLETIDLAHSYHDFKEASQYCKFNNCIHENEPGCMVKQLVEENKIPKSRYEDYLSFLNEIKERKVRY